MAEVHVGGFRAPAGPPDANAYNALSGSGLLVAGVLVENISGKNIPVGATVYATHVGAWVDATKAAPLTAEWDATLQRVTVTSAANTDINRCQWQLWW